ncbi:hypothetical protein [Prevotella sp. LMAG:51]|uniref:hypothetical protein n=1 Tax=Prevotella sp. LMAG:51 TaxID=1969564 RepID=UPI00257B5393|nr:hypothetical protein [Prevotella sp. LMAG:51]
MPTPASILPADKNGSKDNKDAGKGKKTVAYGDPAKFKTSVNQALTALDNMLGYHNGNEKRPRSRRDFMLTR